MKLTCPRQPACPARGIALALLATTSLSITALSAAPAYAQEAASYDIPAGPLPTVLNQFARQAHVELIYDAPLTQSAASPGLKGSFGAAEGLSRILAGTGLTYRQTGPNVFTLERAPTADTGTVQLGPVRVAADGGTATGSNPVEASATSPVKGFVAHRSATGTKTDTPLNEVPQSISVVTRDQLDTRAVTNLSQALNYIPGVTINMYGDDNRFDWLGIRGFGNATGLTWRDGMKTPTWNYVSSRAEPYGAERIEILRGPASILYGGNNPGGVINVVTKRPLDTTYGELRARIGDHDRYGLAGDVSGPATDDGKILYRLTGMWERDDRQKAGSNENRIYVAPAISFRPSEHTTLTLLADYQRDRIDGYSYLNETRGIYDTIFDIDYSQKGWDRYYRKQYSFGAFLDQDLSDSISLHSKVRYAVATADYRLTGANDLVGNILSRSTDWRLDRARTWTTDNYVQANWSIGGIKNVTIAGLDFRHVSGFYQRGTGTAPDFDISTGESLGTFVAPTPIPNYVGWSRQLGAYLQNQFKIDDRFVILAGGRHDWYRESTSTGGAAYVPVKQNAFTGRVGAVYLHPSGLAPYASYTESFEPQTGVDRLGNRFDPTRGHQYEVGLRYEPHFANLRLSAALFDLRKSNVLTTDPVNASFSVQTGEVRSRGVELEANASLAKGLNLTGSYSYDDVKTTKSNNPVLLGLTPQGIPKVRANLWADYRVQSGPIQGAGFGFGARYTGKVWNYLNTYSTTGVTVFDAALSYGFDKWLFSVNAQNLFNKKYVANCYTPDYCFRGERQSIIGTVTYRWR